MEVAVLIRNQPGKLDEEIQVAFHRIRSFLKFTQKLNFIRPDLNLIPLTVLISTPHSP